MKLTIAFLTTMAIAAPLTFEEDCIPEGETADIEFDRPDLGQAGDPANAQWLSTADHTPQAWEDDQHGTMQSGNESMGDADTPDDDPATTEDESETKASVPVENDGGRLRDRNGTAHNGGMLEGDCIEVEVCWKYEYTGWKKRGDAWVETILHGTKCTDSKEVCPCE